MLKENTFYRAKSDFNLTVDFNLNGFRIYEGTILFVKNVRHENDSSRLIATLIIDFKELESYWYQSRIKDLLIKIS